MDAVTADALLAAALDTRAAMRSRDDDALERAERLYPDMRAALDWNLAQGRLDQADRLATALVPFWMATKRVDEGEAWFARAIPEPGTDPRRARAEYDAGHLAFFGGHYELAETRFVDDRTGIIPVDSVNARTAGLYDFPYEKPPLDPLPEFQFLKIIRADR